MDTLIVTAVIFVFTYALISMGNVTGIRINKGFAAILGGALVLLFGIVPVSDLPSLIDLNILFLLIGMMMLVAGLEFSGFFRIVSGILVSHSESKVRLLAYVMILCAALSAVALNDAIVLIFTPIVIRCCRLTGSNPIPYLTGVMFSANIGSLATSVGNPQNAYVASEAGLSFLEFTAYALPISLVCLPVAFFIIYLIFRKRLVSDTAVPPADDGMMIDRGRLFAVTAIMLTALAGFAISDIIGVTTGEIALAAGILTLAVVMTKSPKKMVWVAKRVDWKILLFFIGLFILMGAVEASGLLSHIASAFPGFGQGETPPLAGLTGFSAVLSNLVSNVPGVMLLGSMLPDDTVLWFALAVTSTLAGNATIIGSAANVIVSERAEDADIRFNFWKFALAGVPVAFATLVIAVCMLSVMF